jgi:hypothetical protein
MRILVESKLLVTHYALRIKKHRPGALDDRLNSRRSA